MPVSASNLIAACADSAGVRAFFSCKTSAICSPTVNSGFRAVIGSWKIIAMSWPRIPRKARSGRDSRSTAPSCPAKVALPLMAAFCTRRSRLSAVTVFPEPDSPTSASFSPGWMEKSMPRTTSLPAKDTRRFLTSRRQDMSVPGVEVVEAVERSGGPPRASSAPSGGSDDTSVRSVGAVICPLSGGPAHPAAHPP